MILIEKEITDINLDIHHVIGAVFSVPRLSASILNSSVMLGHYLQQMTSADGIILPLKVLQITHRRNMFPAIIQCPQPTSETPFYMSS